MFRPGGAPVCCHGRRPLPSAARNSSALPGRGIPHNTVSTGSAQAIRPALHPWQHPPGPAGAEGSSPSVPRTGQSISRGRAGITLSAWADDHTQ
jgi:hypothetical protein